MTMTDAHPSLECDVASLRRRLHVVNNELSVAILELELLLEDASLAPTCRSAVIAALNASREAAAQQREIWAMLDGRALHP